MQRDTPWSGLEAGKTNTRRVDASARWNWFWAVMERDEVALVLQLAALPTPALELPKLRNLEIRFQTLTDGPILYLRLKDSAQLELFETLCRDVINAGEVATTEAEALTRAIGRTFRWHYLLRGGKPTVLPEEAQKGLIGEIEVLKLLITTLGAKPALAAWTGPSGAPKDFELDSDCIEVKARRGASQPFVAISSEHQLADVTNRRLWLSVVAVDRRQPPNGRTLTEYVNEVIELLVRTEPSAVLDLDLCLADAGWDSQHDYEAWRWSSADPEFHTVAGDFPRIADPIPLGVSGVTYSLALSACAPFRTDWRSVQTLLAGGSTP
jgi:hypothetical protein